MFSKVWDSVLVGIWWIMVGLSSYLLFTEGLSDTWWDAAVMMMVFDCCRSIRALEKNQESQAS